MRTAIDALRGRIVRRLAESGRPHACHHELVSVTIPTADVMSALELIAGALTRDEQQEVRVAFEPDEEPPQVADYFESGSLAWFMARRQSGWLLDMIREDRLTSVFQPIVETRTERLYGYECLLRGIDEGRLVPSSPILEVALGSGLLFHVDQTARWLALREAARHGIRSRLFVNFAPSGLNNPEEGLDSTVRLLAELEMPHHQVVFEITESQRIADVSQLARILALYRARGFEVALDDVGSGYSTLSLLQELRPDYAKLDLQLVRHVDSNSYKAVITAKLLEASQALGIKTIAEGVESPAEGEWLKAHGADYLQGFLFGHPASPPPLA